MKKGLAIDHVYWGRARVVAVIAIFHFHTGQEKKVQMDDFAGEAVQREVLARYRYKVELEKKRNRWSEEGMHREIEAYRELWRKEDELYDEEDDGDIDFDGDGGPDGAGDSTTSAKDRDAVLRERERIVEEIRRNFKVSLVRKETEGSMDSLIKDVKAIAKEDCLDLHLGPKDVDEELASDEEWEYYSTSDEEDGRDHDYLHGHSDSGGVIDDSGTLVEKADISAEAAAVKVIQGDA